MTNDPFLRLNKSSILSGLTTLLLIPVVVLAEEVIFSSSFEPPVFTEATHPLNDTGITHSLLDETCVDTAQDCGFGRDATDNDDADGHAGFSFTKLDSTGDDLAVSATSWDCVKDNVTGLIWEVKTNEGGLRDRDNTYTWYNPNPEINGGDPGTEHDKSPAINKPVCSVSDCDTSSYVEAVNSLPAALCGYRDWRMPWKWELMSIVDYGLGYPAVDTNYFPWEPSEQGPHVWTNTVLAAWGHIWTVRVQQAADFLKVTYIANRVRLVRSSDQFSPEDNGELR